MLCFFCYPPMFALLLRVIITKKKKKIQEILFHVLNFICNHKLVAHAKTICKIINNIYIKKYLHLKHVMRTIAYLWHALMQLHYEKYTENKLINPITCSLEISINITSKHKVFIDTVIRSLNLYEEKLTKSFQIFFCPRIVLRIYSWIGHDKNHIFWSYKISYQRQILWWLIKMSWSNKKKKWNHSILKKLIFSLLSFSLKWTSEKFVA